MGARWRLGIGVLTCAMLVASPRNARASDILFPGFDLFDPITGTEVFLISDLYPFVGDPLGSFDFGAGPVPTGNADTIIERLTSAMGPGSVSIPVQLRAMQLVSTTPIDIGFGLDFHYLTLQAAASLGTMVWTEDPGFHGPPPPPHGVANYLVLNWLFDVRLGSLGGPVVFSDLKTLSSDPTPWSHFPPPGAVLIPGVNSFLNGTSPDNDFFFLETFSLNAADGTHILTQTATIPEPATLSLCGIALAGLAVRCRRLRRGRYHFSVGD
jgi:PEP-CTERM motif